MQGRNRTDHLSTCPDTRIPVRFMSVPQPKYPQNFRLERESNHRRIATHGCTPRHSGCDIFFSLGTSNTEAWVTRGGHEFLTGALRPVSDLLGKGPDLRFRKPLLYPAELRDQLSFFAPRYFL